MSSNDNIKLEAINITKTYGKTIALHKLNITMQPGIYGLLGPNGAGKTTFIKILLGILSPDEGFISINDKVIKNFNEEYLDFIGYMPQYPQFYGNFTVKEFLEYISLLKGICKAGMKDLVKETLEKVNLTNASMKKISELSGGMRQRLGIAQAILNDPKILILDEPTAGLDPKERIRFRNIISKLSKDKIIIYATHIVSDIEMIANHVLFLRLGELVLEGSIKDVESSMDGKVWEVEIKMDEFYKLSDNYVISNVKQIDQNYLVRIIHHTQPIENAKKVKPNLEDVFLSIFDDEVITV